MLLSKFAAEDAVLVDAEGGTAVTATDIRERAYDVRALVPPGAVAFLLVSPGVTAARDFHALIEARVPVALLDAGAAAGFNEAIIETYRPDVIVGVPPPLAGYEASSVECLWRRRAPVGVRAHPDLSVLLTTSGSTGSPKFVRLSQTNIAANAKQIVASLGIRANDRGVTLLPIHYSFGMSILTSHAVAGSPVVVTTGSVLEPSFWEQVRDHRVTFLPGVPQTYQMLKRLRFLERELPDVRALIQAGGRLDPVLVEEFIERMRTRGGQFFVMYGQTEAAPRIACLPPDRLPEKLGSAGQALPDGRLEAIDADGASLPPGTPGQIRYIGPNVMMGYSESRSDLALGDTQGDCLDTGDLGHVDEEGFLFLTGRSKRIAKVAGLRISLDDVERLAGSGTAAVEKPAGAITLFIHGDADGYANDRARVLAKQLRIPPKSVRSRLVEHIPLLPSGKVDYRTLEATAGET